MGKFLSTIRKTPTVATALVSFLYLLVFSYYYILFKHLVLRAS
jgi:hypothetical protein